MTEKDLIQRMDDFQAQMETIEQDLVQDNAYSCIECGDRYHTDIAAVTGNDCLDCYQEKKLGILPGQQVSVIEVPGASFMSGHREYQEPHHCVDRAVKAHEESGGVFNLGRPL
jgi:hypothetical protein